MKAMDSVAPLQYSQNPTNILSRWKTIVTLASKVGKGSCKHNESQILHTKYWLEAIDPLHRYGKNLKLYHEVWFNSQSSQPFLYWIDFGDGKEIDLKECPKTELQQQRIRYLGPKEREAYAVMIEKGKMIYKESGEFVHTHTPEETKWMFVLSSTITMFVGQKEKGQFQHSSFLCGAATLASGRLIVHQGTLQAVWGYSGHYCPTQDNMAHLLRFLHQHRLDLTDVKMCAMDDDVLPRRLTAKLIIN